MSYRSPFFQHPVPLDVPDVGYGAPTVGAGQFGITKKGSIWTPPIPGGPSSLIFVAYWAEDNWSKGRALDTSKELKRYQDATVAVRGTFDDAKAEAKAQVSGSASTSFWGVTKKQSVWSPSSGDNKTFIAYWQQDGWGIPRAVSRSEQQRYSEATVKQYPYTDAGLKDALKYAKKKAGVSETSSSSSSSSSSTSSYTYTPAPALTPAPSPSAGPTTVALTDQPWFWPAAVGGTIAVGALVWMLLPKKSRPKVIVKQVTSRFTGF